MIKMFTILSNKKSGSLKRILYAYHFLSNRGYLPILLKEKVIFYANLSDD